MKIAIVGAAYTGLAAARHFRSQGHQVSVSTTRPDRVAELAPVATEVVVTKGSDVAGMQKLIAGADAVVLTMAGGLGVKDGKPYMDPVAYRDSYVGTADGLIASLPAAPRLRAIVFCSSLNAYGDAHGVSPVLESTPACTTVAVARLIWAQRIQFTVPPPGLQAMVMVVQPKPLRYSKSRGRQSPESSEPPPD